MKAVVLAGGFGKRLRPLTDDRPKPMIKVLEVPIIEWQLRWLSGHGIKDFVLCVGYMKEKITEHIGSGDRLGVKVEYAIEKAPLGTGGALLNASEMLQNETKGFFMVNGDILTDLDPTMLNKDNSMTLALVPLRSPFGVVEIDSKSNVLGFVEKPKISNSWINAGVYFFTNKIFELLPENGNIEVTALPALAKARSLRAVKYDTVFWRSIDSHKDIEEATNEIQATPLARS